MHAAELWHQLGTIDRLAGALAGLVFGATLLAALWELACARGGARKGGSARASEGTPDVRRCAPGCWSPGDLRVAPFPRPGRDAPTPPRRARRGAVMLATLAIGGVAGAVPLVLLLR